MSSFSSDSAMLTTMNASLSAGGEVSLVVGHQELLATWP
jgi:hypothetical protein